MTWLRAARAIGGLMTIATILVLVGANVLYGADALDPTQVTLLVGLVSALLGVDMLSERLPIRIEAGPKDDKEGPD